MVTQRPLGSPAQVLIVLIGICHLSRKDPHELRTLVLSYIQRQARGNVRTVGKVGWRPLQLRLYQGPWEGTLLALLWLQRSEQS